MRILERARLPYMIVGAHAVFVHGTPRLSLDLDVVVPFPPDRRDEVRQVLEGSELSSFVWSEDPQWGRRLRCRTRENMLVEIFLSGQTELQHREFERRVQRKVDGHPIWFLSAEDLVLRKLVTCRIRAGMDYTDVVSILVTQGDAFDTGYVKRHCAVHRVCGLFDRAAVEARERRIDEP